jgi:hypothetical protein
MRPVLVMMFALAAPAAGIVLGPPARSLRTPAPTAAATFLATTPSENSALANEGSKELLDPTSFMRGPRSRLNKITDTCGSGVGGAIVLAVNQGKRLGDLMVHGPPYVVVAVVKFVFR